MCECGNRLITLNSCILDDFVPDQEPYKDGVCEDLTNSDQEFVESLYVNINFNACSKCGSVYVFFEDDTFKNGKVLYV